MLSLLEQYEGQIHSQAFSQVVMHKTSRDCQAWLREHCPDGLKLTQAIDGYLWNCISLKEPLRRTEQVFNQINSTNFYEQLKSDIQQIKKCLRIPERQSIEDITLFSASDKSELLRILEIYKIGDWANIASAKVQLKHWAMKRPSHPVLDHLVDYKADLTLVEEMIPEVENLDDFKSAIADPAPATGELPIPSGDHIKVGARLGVGGDAKVYEGTDTRLNRLIALRFLGESSNRSMGHARTLAKAKHPSIVSVIDIAMIPHPDFDGIPKPAVLLEKIEGCTLEEFKLSGLSIQDARRIGLGIITGIRHMHSIGLVHGDLHSENVMVTENEVKIIDLSNSDLFDAFSTMRMEAARNRDVRMVVMLLLELLLLANSENVESVKEFGALRKNKDLSSIESIFVSILSSSKTNQTVTEDYLSKDRYSPLEFRLGTISGNKNFNAKVVNIGDDMVRRVKTSIVEYPEWPGQDLGSIPSKGLRDCIFRSGKSVDTGTITLRVEYRNRFGNAYRVEYACHFTNGSLLERYQRDYVFINEKWVEIN